MITYDLIGIPTHLGDNVFPLRLITKCAKRPIYASMCNCVSKQSLMFLHKYIWLTFDTAPVDTLLYIYWGMNDCTCGTRWQYIHSHNLVYFICTILPVLSGHSKRRPKLTFKTDYCLMQVKSIAECSKKALCNTFDLHEATICCLDLCFV